MACRSIYVSICEIHRGGTEMNPYLRLSTGALHNCLHLPVARNGAAAILLLLVVALLGCQGGAPPEQSGAASTVGVPTLVSEVETKEPVPTVTPVPTIPPTVEVTRGPTVPPTVAVTPEAVTEEPPTPTPVRPTPVAPEPSPNRCADRTHCSCGPTGSGGSGRRTGSGPEIHFHQRWIPARLRGEGRWRSLLLGE